MALSYPYSSQASSNQSAIFDSLRPTIFDQSQDQSYIYKISTDTSWESTLDAAIRTPTEFTILSMDSYDVGYAGSQSTSSGPSPEALLKEITSESREKKRKTQNRDSQRAYRARAREKEEQSSALISQLKREIEALKSREKCNIEQVKVLKQEIARLKGEK